MNSYNARYKEQIAKFTKKDGLLAICYFGYLMALSFALSFFFQSQMAYELSIDTLLFIHRVVRPILGVAPAFVIALLRKQGLSSIGFHTKNLGKALLLGLVFSVIALMLYSGVLPGIVQGGQLQPFSVLTEALMITLVYAAWEDIVFQGYIQPRLHGIVKSNIIAVLIGALFFALVHVPVFVVVDGLSGLSILASATMAAWIGGHVIYNLVFRKYFSIFPVIMLHTFINFSSQGDIWESGVTSVDEVAPFPISFVIITVAVILWAVYESRKSKRGEAR